MRDRDLNPDIDALYHECRRLFIYGPTPGEPEIYTLEDLSRAIGIPLERTRAAHKVLIERGILKLNPGMDPSFFYGLESPQP